MNEQFFEVFSPFHYMLWHMSVCNSRAAVMENFTKYYLGKYKMSLSNRKMTIISWSKFLGKKVFAAKNWYIFKGFYVITLCWEPSLGSCHLNISIHFSLVYINKQYFDSCMQVNAIFPYKPFVD